MFHAAAVIHPRRSVRELFDVNVGGTQLMLDRARRAGAARFVHVSSNSPFGVNPGPDDVFTEESPYTPYMGYGRSKQEAEQLVKQAHDRGDLGTVTVRAPWFYGPYQPPRQSRFFIAIRKGRSPWWATAPSGGRWYTDNLVQGLLRAEVPTRRPATPTGWPTPSPRAARDPRHGGGHWASRGWPCPAPSGCRCPGRRPGRRRWRMPCSRGAGATPGPAVLGELNHTIACDITRARRRARLRADGLEEGMRASIRWCLEHGRA